MKNDCHEIQPFFREGADRLLKEIPRDGFSFALVTDSHLGDTRANTCANIKYMDQELNYRFLVHMGDFLCGNIPDLATRKLLKDEIDAFRSSIESQTLFVTQGNHDGYCDENFRNGTYGQRDIAIDENWYEATSFIDQYDNTTRPNQKPYYYVDFPEEKLRMVFLCTNWYEMNWNYRVYRKHYGLSKEQLHWFADSALNTPTSGWNVMLFSHIPALNMGNLSTLSAYHHGGKEAIALLKAYRDGGTVLVDDICYSYHKQDNHVLAWCSGHGHGDMTQKQEGIHFVGTASALANVPVTWEEPLGYFPAPRVIGTFSEDAWDTVVWQKDQQKLLFKRFGAGENREILYD